MGRKLVIALIVLVFTALLFCFFYVKPGVSRYRHIQSSGEIIRVDKLTTETTRWCKAGRYTGGNSWSLRDHWHKSANCPNCEKRWW